MLSGFDMPKTAPSAVAKGILDGVTAGLEDTYQTQLLNRSQECGHTIQKLSN